VNLGLNQENKAASLILAVEGYAAYALSVVNIINGALCITSVAYKHNSVRNGFAVATGVLLLERRLISGWLVAYNKLYS